MLDENARPDPQGMLPLVVILHHVNTVRFANEMQQPSDLKSVATESTSARIVGLDVARAFAIAGMALIHFATVLASEDFDTHLGWIVDRLAGRPATAFMLLAGIGVSLQLHRSISDTRRRLWRRGLFFAAFGFVNLVLWPGDILRVYGVAYLAAVLFVSANSRSLITAASLIVVTFLGMVFTIDFETNWDFSTLDYSNLWTWSGATMNLFYNGFRAVFPWTALFFTGMAIGRLDLRSHVVQKRLIVFGLLVWLVAELSSAAMVQFANAIELTDRESIHALLGTDSLPPMPMFLLSSGGIMVALIATCIATVDRSENPAWSRPIASAGQLAFTWYIAHIIVVIAAGLATGFRGDVAMSTAFAVSALFLAMMIAVSHVYRKAFRFGPLEFVLRWVAK